MEENKENESVSKITAMLGQSQDDLNNAQYTVHYSENDWETNEEINIILDKNATIKQMADIAIQKYKTELFYDNIDKKQLIVKIFKKKKKIPNDEYPVCNFDSKVNDFGKSHFCLVEIVKEEKKEDEKDNKNEDIIIQKNEPNENNNKVQENQSNSKNVINKEVSGGNTTEGNFNNNSNNNYNSGNNGTNNTKSCRPCMIV